MTSARRILIPILIGAGLIVAADRVKIQPYELEYLRADPPAYHPTVMKRLMGAVIADEAEKISGILRARHAVSVLRLAGLCAALAAATAILGRMRGWWAFGIFFLMPPSIPYLVRLDAWMDSVSFVFIAIFFLGAAEKAEGKKMQIFYALAGLFSGLALDSKLTAALTLVPLVALWFFSGPVKNILFFSAGLGTAALTQINWILHPSQAVDHIAYWNSINMTLPLLPVSYGWTALASAVPASVLLLAGLGLVLAGRDKTVWASALLAAATVGFFMFYRTFNPDGFRHLYLTLAFLAVLAADALAKFRPIFKIGFLVVWILELLFRKFPEF